MILWKEKSDKGKWLLLAKKTMLRRTKFYTDKQLKKNIEAHVRLWEGALPNILITEFEYND